MWAIFGGSLVVFLAVGCVIFGDYCVINDGDGFGIHSFDEPYMSVGPPSVMKVIYFQMPGSFKLQEITLQSSFGTAH